MWVRRFLIGLVIFLCTSCASETPTRNLVELGIQLSTDEFIYNYEINENDEVREIILLYSGPIGIGRLVTLDERRDTVEGAYAKLVADGAWADSVMSAPIRDDEDYREHFNQGYRPTYNMPALSVMVHSHPSGKGTDVSSLPVPTHNEPQLGLQPEWAPERKWIGQMVGQFIDVVGKPSLNPEDHLYRFNEEGREWLPVQLNFSDYR